MEGVLNFTLPEESEEFEMAQQGANAIAALFEIKNNVWRRYLKWGDLTSEQYKIAEKIFEDINEEIPDEIHKFL